MKAHAAEECEAPYQEHVQRGEALVVHLTLAAGAAFLGLVGWLLTL